MLVNMRDLLADARVGGYAVGSFSVANMEMVLGVLQAAEELRAPVILQIAEVRLRQSPLELIGPLMVAAARQASVPVAVHFDHGKTKKKIGQALELGFTSVMFDGSHLPLDENIAETCRIIEMARPYGAAVEAEIGCVGGSEDGSEEIAMHCTDPADAVRFEQETGVDALAIAIGNAHGNYKATPKLRFDILAQVAEDTHTPWCSMAAPAFRRRISAAVPRQGSKRSTLPRPLLTAWSRRCGALTTPVLSAVTTICKGQRCRGRIRTPTATF